MAVKEDALKMAGYGLSVLPIEKGTKKFKGISWKAYQTRLMEEAEIATMFVEGDFLAVVCGEVSGHLELIDFDIPGKHEIIEGKKGVSPVWKDFLTFCKDHEFEYLIKKVLIVETKSGGKHLIYRCPSGVEGNQKLAEQEEEGVRETLIETRGEGGYFLTYPTPGYTILQGSFQNIPEITAGEREFLLTAASSFNQIYEQRHAGHKVNGPGLKPGEDYEQRTTWEELLTKHGWTLGGRSSGGRTSWVRPGKTKKEGIGATTGNGPTDLLYIHTTNAHPFEVRKSYSKFAAYTLLEHGGDFFHATKVLGQQGYGQRARQPATNGRIPGPDPSILDTDAFEADDFHAAEAEEYEWLWNPYLIKGHLNLLDAKGGAGKTTLIMATALSLSEGLIPFGGECEPVHTVYFGTEDTTGEMKALQKRLGFGDCRYFHPINKVFRLDAEGVAKVLATIEKYKASLCVFDAITYYFAGMVKNPWDGMEIAPHLNRLRGVARETNCAIWNIRHFSRGAENRDLADMGAGSEQWRNSHRRQLVLRPHPDIPRYSIAAPARGALLAGAGEPFAFSMQNDIFGWIKNPDMSVFEQKNERISRLEEAKQFIRKTCTGQYILSTEVWAKAKAASISEPTLKRASREMKEDGELTFKTWTKGGEWNWHIPTSTGEVEDPFEKP
jgi:hypothetical protein